MQQGQEKKVHISEEDRAFHNPKGRKKRRERDSLLPVRAEQSEGLKRGLAGMGRAHAVVNEDV